MCSFFSPSVHLTPVRFVTSLENMPVFNQSPQLTGAVSVFLSPLIFPIKRLSVPYPKCLLQSLPSLSLIGGLNSLQFPSSLFLFSSALPEFESQHRNAVVTQTENCNSRKICLLFGLVVLNPNELSNSAGKELSLFPARVICTTRKEKMREPSSRKGIFWS